jgi:hypothetical protein
MPFHRRTAAFAPAFAAAAISLQPAVAQLHERRQAQIEQSAQATPVSGVTFRSPLPYEKCFDAVSNDVKRNGREIESGNKDTRIRRLWDIRRCYVSERLGLCPHREPQVELGKMAATLGPARKHSSSPTRT